MATKEKKTKLQTNLVSGIGVCQLANTANCQINFGD
jgi:hypothetical protein